ncbi:hypothetical protein ACFYYR_02830 [Streptomyces sp. NPDC001922]|uniref:hypothetical protein n=1 Tax=Streptomyces sp. NPDC001922 TaxID=3364624 RepID=UPI0036A5AEED
MRGAVARRRTALGVVVLMVVGLAGLAGSGTAEAAAARCEGRKVKTLSLPGGRIHIHRTRLFACAFTVATDPGKRRKMSVSIQARGTRPRWDTGYYSHHAGPVRVAAGQRCVFVRGSVGGRSVSSGWLC